MQAPPPASPTFHDLSFVQRTSKVSPKLFLACATGEHLKTAILTTRKAGQVPFEFLTITLDDVVVSSFQEKRRHRLRAGRVGHAGLCELAIVYTGRSCRPARLRRTSGQASTRG